MKRLRVMSARQCEIAAEAYSASLLAQCGYDVLVQYGANQPDYDLVAEKNGRFLPISVKGSQDGGWMLAVRYKNESTTYLEAIDAWRNAQREEVIFLFIQFRDVKLGEAPRAYLARPEEIASHMKTQCEGRGHGALREDNRKLHPNSKYDYKIPNQWGYSLERLNSI